jgi:pyruvate ferredoxin oxidoreductase delta subunit
MVKITIGATNPDAGSAKIYKTGDWRSMRPEIDYKKCTKKCFFCFEFCPDSSVTITDDGPKIDYNHCKGCGICVFECPKKAIELKSEEK